MGKKRRASGIFPMPREIRIRKGIEYPANRIAVILPEGTDPVYGTIAGLMEQYHSPSHGMTDFEIKFLILDEKSGKKSYRKLSGKKNNEQAYIISSDTGKGVFSSIEVAALDPVGLLYGTLTLGQALSKEGDIVSIPVIDAVDWPEVAYRGQWGGNSNCDIPWTFQFKLNALDGKVYVSADEEGNPTVVHNNRLYREAEAHGIDVRATIPHLEQISRRGFLEKRSDVLNVPSDERKGRSDYFPGLCMSKKATEDMIYEWFVGIARNEMVKKILVWLSEESTPCHCDDCRGKEPFQLETACLLRAYSRLGKEYPDIELGIMLSQGSYEVTDRIAGMLPKDVTLTYYDGGRTYDSGRYPMIMPCLEKFVKKGGRLGVYPQITHSWRTVFPFTAPSFIKYRCDEFAGKGLERVIGYAVPSNRYHEFNLMAMAEWLWNPDGRKVRDFIHDYAKLRGIEPGLFTEYMAAIEKPAWKLAESKLMLRLTYNYPLILRGQLSMEDHRYEMAELLPIRELGKNLSGAEKALAIAREMGQKQYIYEAKCVIAGLIAYRSVTTFIKEISGKKVDTDKLLACYEDLRKAAVRMRKSIGKWSGMILPPGREPMKRVVDTQMVLYRVLDGMKRYFDETGVLTESDPATVKPLAEWDETDFTDTKAVKKIDITDYIRQNGKGTYYISLDFTEGESGTDFDRITLVERSPAGGEKCVAYVTAERRRLSVWAPWNEYPLKVRKPSPGCRYMLRMDMSAMEKGEKTCRGLIGIRKV